MLFQASSSPKGVYRLIDPEQYREQNVIMVGGEKTTSDRGWLKHAVLRLIQVGGCDWADIRARPYC
jgi:hypothetical protein